VNSPEASSQTQGQALPAGTRLEEFVIEKVLGAGGFGITYLARDVSLDRHVVIKENLPVQFAFRDTHSLTVAPRHSHGEDAGNFAWSLENFSKEAAMLASLDHTGIVKVLRRFEAFGTAYFVMPYVDGIPLDELMQQRCGKPFAEDELRGLLERVLHALAYLHDRGIYHRDIKPSNILITSEGIPVLIDFGSARQRLSERSMTVVESAGYTPFEQLQSRGNVGPWSDLYALGATLTRILTGDLPPKAMDRMRRDPFEPLAEREALKGKYSHLLLASIDKALRVDVDDRWPDAMKWRAALVTEEHGTRIELPSHRLPERELPLENPPNRTAPRRRPTRKIVAYVMLAVLVGGLIIGLTRELLEMRDLRKAALLLASGKVGEGVGIRIPNGEAIVLRYVPGGRFQMGTPASEAKWDDTFCQDEEQVSVTLSNHFWMGETEVTQGQWMAVMGSNPSYFKGGDWKKRPVENVSWNEAREFIQKLNADSPPGAGWKWALPTEAQWERACRGGTTTATAFGNSLSSLQANFNGNYPYGGAAKGPYLEKTAPVKSYEPNAYKLYDMHGNIPEWCADTYQETLPGGVDPLITTGWNRVIRGGGFGRVGLVCRSSSRHSNGPDYRNDYGFRLAVVPPR
jgi:formylglycine-generating enzyme required for sulfatase activity/serine/threonine protein kinase